MAPNYRVNPIGFYPDNLYYESGIRKVRNDYFHVWAYWACGSQGVLYLAALSEKPIKI